MTFQKLCGKFLAGLFLVILLPQTAFAFYSDVPETHKYYAEIQNLYDNGLLPEEEKFNPDKTLTTTDFYKLLLTYGQAKLSENINLPYSNTDNNADYSPYLQTAIDLGLLKISGIKPPFNFNETVSKYRALKQTFESLGVGINYFFDRNSFPFDDLKTTAAQAPVAYKAYEVGVVEDSKPNLFKSARRISKAEMAHYLYLVQQYSPGESVIHLEISNANPDDGTELSKAPSYNTLAEIWDKLKNNFYYKDSLDEQDLIFSAIEGMVNEIQDPYTVFQRPADANSFLDSLSSEYEGIGTAIDIVDNVITITSVFHDSPAEKAGLKSGDQILKVDGESVSEMTVDEVATMIRGEKGTTVELTISRDKKTKTYKVTRDSVLNQTVFSEVLTKGTKKIGYMEISSFNTDTYSEFVDRANELIAEKVSGIILDLRNNPGGYMDTAVDIASLFSDQKKTAVKLVFSDKSTEEYKTDGNGLLKKYKVIILMNKNSASASEILAGALQDFKIAKVIGTVSYGKGTVQEVYQYDDGSLFKFTISKWLTPNGRDINKKGITPDKEVTQSETEDDQLDAALAEF